MGIDANEYVGGADLQPVDTGNGVTSFAQGFWNGVKMPVDVKPESGHYKP